MEKLVVFIASPLMPGLIDQIRAIDPDRVEVIYEPDLLPRMRFASDHAGEPVVHTPEQHRRWCEHLSRADVLWDFPADDPDGSGGLAYAPRVKWIQATSTGISHKILARGLQDSPIICTSARGTHGSQSAEFVFLALLMHAKNFRHLQSDQQAHRWTTYCMDELAGKTLAIVGAGHMGASVAVLGKAFQMRVVATARHHSAERAAALGIDAFYPRAELAAMAAEADALVITVPHTPETERMIDAAVFDALKPGAVFVNVGRGKVVDETALIHALETGRVAFAGLDVFEVEPLPPTSPLWDMPNVLISPHSSSIVPGLHAGVVELFCYNLRCFLDGRLADMRNAFDKRQLY
jgi:phosphoglycerate dehydrogenase-like enzyme